MVAPTPAPRRPIARVLPVPPLPALVTMLAFTGLLYLVEAVNWATNDSLEVNGILPREFDGLDGVLWAPLLHDSWWHLLGNTVPFLVFGFLAMAGGIGRFVAVTATVWILGGFGVWLTAGSGTDHFGASGLVFGWFAFLLARGFFARSVGQIALAVVLFAIWGSILYGVLPSDPHVSWQGHLFGALAGLLAAWLVSGADRRTGPEPLTSP